LGNGRGFKGPISFRDIIREYLQLTNKGISQREISSSHPFHCQHNYNCLIFEWAGPLDLDFGGLDEFVSKINYAILNFIPLSPSFQKCD
jgi:hypothetical protein